MQLRSLLEHKISGSYSAADLGIQQIEGIELFFPTMFSKVHKQGQITLEQLELDKSGITTVCLQGHTSTFSSVSHTKIDSF